MPSYEQKLAAFIEGKSLIRLPRPIRDRADVCCDACGSNHPRTLYALKESGSNRHYFVGNTCLKELVKLGVILRRFGRESGQTAYETEMKLRTAGSEEQSVHSSADPAGPADTRLDSVPTAFDPLVPERILLPSVLILESPDHYQAVVSFFSSRGVAYGWGCAQEPRYTKALRQGGERGLVLEEVNEETPNAPGLCLTRAWEEAISHLDVSYRVSADRNENGRHHQRSNFLGPFLTLLRLDSAGAVSADFSPSFRIGCRSLLQSLANPSISRMEAA